jgi:hypothetical protein
MCSGRPWGWVQVRAYLLRRFVKVWKFPYSALGHVACLAKGLAAYDAPLAVAIVDNVLEAFRVGIEVCASDPSLCAHMHGRSHLCLCLCLGFAFVYDCGTQRERER